MVIKQGSCATVPLSSSFVCNLQTFAPDGMLSSELEKDMHPPNSHHASWLEQEPYSSWVTLTFIFKVMTFIFKVMTQPRGYVELCGIIFLNELIRIQLFIESVVFFQWTDQTLSDGSVSKINVSSLTNMTKTPTPLCLPPSPSPIEPNSTFLASLLLK